MGVGGVHNIRQAGSLCKVVPWHMMTGRGPRGGGGTFTGWSGRPHGWGWVGCGGGALVSHSHLTLSSQPLLCERRLVRHCFIVVSPQLGDHVDEGQALDLFVKGLWRGEQGGGREDPIKAWF